MGQLALTGVVTWFILSRVGLGVDQLDGVDRSAWWPAPIPFAAACVLLLGAYFVSATLWGRIVADLGGPALPGREAIPLFMIANLGRYLPGKFWQIAGLASLARSRGIPAGIATGAALLGQGVALAAATAVGLGALLGGTGDYGALTAALALAVVVGAVVCTLPSVFPRLAALWFRLARSETPPGLQSVHGLRWLSLYTLNWMMYAGAFWVLCVSLGQQGPLLPVASAFAAAYVLGYVMIFAPAGLGPREGFLIAFLTPHFGPAQSGVIAIVARLWTTGVELVPAALFWTRHVARSAATRSAPPGPGQGPG